MSDIIDFNSFKNNATEKDIEKFEQYMQNVFYGVMEGKININEAPEKIKEWLQNNNISEEKFKAIQEKLMERYSDELGLDLNQLGIDLKQLGLEFDINETMEINTFQEKYKSKLYVNQIDEYFATYKLNNNINEGKVILSKDEVTIVSQKKVNIDDKELNELLCDYKKILKGEKLNITVADNCFVYKY
ncbi:DUF3867 family protein [Clostridium aestuarii]|uniref:DUF3867 family protein n=1 Tax=Clostridium aestuarii TaxID=338193 RepID=A0ABT4D1I7_9CLOT|nr:DUF3867 family protein [Clostridium aestuarii]MCY6485111.1 DUF3867 family protein [Clostridium aestuarii]